MCDWALRCSLRIRLFFISTEYWAVNAKNYKNFVTSLCNSVTQKTVCENQCIVDFNYSVVNLYHAYKLYGTVEEAEIAPLFKIWVYTTRLERRAYFDALPHKNTRKEETSSLNTGSELDYLRYVNMICDASDAFWSSNIVMFLLRLKRILE